LFSFEQTCTKRAPFLFLYKGEYKLVTLGYHKQNIEKTNIDGALLLKILDDTPRVAAGI
jgi:hypothetical protein